jgi:hypothetical protein
MVFCSDFPRAIPDPQRAIEIHARAMVKTLGATVLSEKELPGKTPGREYHLRAAAGFSSRIRYYAVANRLYQLTAARPGYDASSPEVDRFFDSFRLAD